MGLIPAGTQTLAKGPGQYVNGASPKYLARGKGATCGTSTATSTSISNMGIGPVSLGYAYPRVDDAISAQLEDGITFSLTHPLEVEVAELVREVVPGAESVRYSKTGCDATTAAVRLARAFTGRKQGALLRLPRLARLVHRRHRSRTAASPQQHAILSFTFQYNDLQSVEDALDDDTACVILEPTVFEAPEGHGFLQRCSRTVHEERRAPRLRRDVDGLPHRPRRRAGALRRHRRSCLLLQGGRQRDAPLDAHRPPSTSCACCEKDVFFFTTFGGEALSLAAAQRHHLTSCGRSACRSTLARQGKKLKDGYNALGAGARPRSGHRRASVTITARSSPSRHPPGPPRRPLEMKSLVQQEMIARGVLWGGFHTCASPTPTPTWTHVLAAYREVLGHPRRVASPRATVEKARLRGEPVEPVFRKTTNFHMKPKRA